MSHKDDIDWTEYGLTGPPENDDEVTSWQNEVLSLILSRLEEYEERYWDCPVTKIKGIWVPLVAIAGGLTSILGLVYLIYRIRALVE